MRRLQDQYDETGMRRSVDAVIVCQVGGEEGGEGEQDSRLSTQLTYRTMAFPVSSLCRSQMTSSSCEFRRDDLPSSTWTDDRPGGYLDPSEDDVSGLIRHLDDLLGTGTKQWRHDQPHWDVRELLAVWYRPNFDGFFVSVVTPSVPGSPLVSLQARARIQP